MRVKRSVAIVAACLSILILSSPVTALPYFGPFAHWHSEVTEVPVARLDRESIVRQLESADVTAVTATYMDGSATIAEMAASSKLIAVVQVTSRAQYSPAAVAVTATVTRVIKGEAPKEEIVIFQLGNLGFIQQMRQVSRLSDGMDGLLNEREYLLFLGKQDDGQAHTFFIRAGTQGIFYTRPPRARERIL